MPTLRSMEGISRIDIEGLKSIGGRLSLNVGKLTILAGANSSGKSTVMQGLLLQKQTLNAPFDPGPLLLNGDNVKFSEATQLLHTGLGGGTRTSTRRAGQIAIGIATERGQVAVETTYRVDSKEGLDIERTASSYYGKAVDLTPGLASDRIRGLVQSILPGIREIEGDLVQDAFAWSVKTRRCFLVAVRQPAGGQGELFYSSYEFGPDWAANLVRGIIHLPGLRGNPERSYPVTAVGQEFPGQFQNYMASLIHNWKSSQAEKVQQLGQDLSDLGLTWKVETRPVDDTSLAVQVGRTRTPARGGARDLVNIADVGLGVSQVLPVLVALRAATPGQLVYLEQPEIHLHPSAQYALARILLEAAARGSRVIVETHSSLLLRGLQVAIAKEKVALPPKEVALHWFSRDDAGVTGVTSCTLDEEGAFGDWPADFDDISLQADSDYLDAVADRPSRP